MGRLKHIHFVNSAWPGSHPVYHLIHQHPPYGWSIDLPGDDAADLVISPTRPWYDGKRPWLVFIEDWVTLYHSDILNGATEGVDVARHPKTAALRSQFEQPTFRGIVCHHRGTFTDLVCLNLTNKLRYVPVGIPRQHRVPVGVRPEVTFLFINSWMNAHWNFRNRGGELVLRAFRELWQSGRRDLRLRVLCGIPPDTDPKETNFALNCEGVQVLQHHVPDDQFTELIRTSDCLLLPSHRVHVHSVLMPFSHGLPVICSDGWGLNEYVTDGVTGFQVRGMYGVVTWHDQVMRENYSKWPQTLPMVAGLKERMVALADCRWLLSRMGMAAHQYVNDVHPIERQQGLLKELFDNSVAL